MFSRKTTGLLLTLKIKNSKPRWTDRWMDAGDRIICDQAGDWIWLNRLFCNDVTDRYALCGSLKEIRENWSSLRRWIIGCLVLFFLRLFLCFVRKSFRKRNTIGWWQFVASFQLNKRVFSMLITFFERFSTKKRKHFWPCSTFCGKRAIEAKL